MGFSLSFFLILLLFCGSVQSAMLQISTSLFFYCLLSCLQKQLEKKIPLQKLKKKTLLVRKKEIKEVLLIMENLFRKQLTLSSFTYRSTGTRFICGIFFMELIPISNDGDPALCMLTFALGTNFCAARRMEKTVFCVPIAYVSHRAH